MPRSPEDNQEIREARCKAIVSAATRVFAKKGFAGAKISDIASEAGFSHGLVYHYFPSKDAIFARIAEQMMDEVDRQMELPYERALDRLLEAMERRLGTIETPFDETRVIMQAVLERTVPDEVQARLVAHFRRIFERIERWVTEAQAQGDIEPEVHASELAAGLVCLFRGMSLRVPGMVALPFELPRLQTIARMLCLTPRARVRLAQRTTNAGERAPSKKPGNGKKNTTKDAHHAKRRSIR